MSARFWPAPNSLYLNSPDPDQETKKEVFSYKPEVLSYKIYNGELLLYERNSPSEKAIKTGLDQNRESQTAKDAEMNPSGPTER